MQVDSHGETSGPHIAGPNDTNSDHARVHSEGLHSAVWERVALGVEPMRPTNQRDTAVVFSRVGVSVMMGAVCADVGLRSIHEGGWTLSVKLQDLRCQLSTLGERNRTTNSERYARTQVGGSINNASAV